MDKSLRIALLTYSTKARGGVVHTVELAEALQTRGHQVTIYALDKDGGGFYRSVQCPVRQVPTLPVIGAIDRVIAQRIQEFVTYFEQHNSTHDCYHSQDCISANALVLLRQKGRIPHFVRTVHHVDDFTSPYLQQCQETAIREPDLCLCVSRHWQAALLEDYQIQALRVTNGVDTTRFSPTNQGAALKKHLGLGNGPIFITVGGIEPRKNSLVLLKAFIQVLSQYPQAQLVIAGGETLFDYDPYRREFFALMQQAGLEKSPCLILPGVMKDQDMPALYRTAQAFVFPSLKEGWGLAVLEALASGIPVITANQPPFTEFLTAEDALLIDPTAVTALAEAMGKVLNPEVYQLLIPRGLAVSARYTWAASAQVHEQIYTTFLTNFKECN